MLHRRRTVDGKEVLQLVVPELERERAMHDRSA